MTDAPRKPTSQGLRSGLFLLDPDPELIPHERRRVEFTPYRTNAFDDHAHDPSLKPALRLVLVMAGALGLILAMGLGLTGCVSTEFATDRVTVSRVSVFSDVNVEATMGADGSITVKERQAQTAVEAAISRIPVVAP